MIFDPHKHHRRSIRLKGSDYSQPGWYFITLCTKICERIFGEVVDDKMVLNDAGEMIKLIWDEIPIFYPGIKIDQFQIMPNHLHGIINIVGADPRICPKNKTTNTGQSQGIEKTKGQSQGIAPTVALPDLVKRFKSLTTKRYIDGVKKNGWESFNGKLWHRNYYEHIIRNESELNRIRKYILENPAKWQGDKYF